MSHSSVNVAKVAKAAPTDQKQVFRLTDMEVEEVSLVDRAANKKKFLVVKKESDPMSVVKATEVTPNGKGGFTTQPSGAAKAGAASCSASGMPGKKKPAAKAGALEVPPGFKEAAGPLLDKVVAMVEDLATQLKGSTPAEISDEGDLPGVPAEFSAAAQKVGDLLNKITTMWPTAPAEASPEEDAVDGGADDAEEGGAPAAPSDMQMRLAEKALVDSAAILKRADVKKIGAKMSKDRFTRLQQAAQVLSNLIGELAPAPDAPAAPALGKAKAPTPPPGAAKPGAKPGEDDEKDKEKAKKVDDALLAIGKALEGLGTTVKSLQSDITSIKKSRGLPNAIQGEAGDGNKAEAEEKVSWPLDMNRPVTKDSVSKTESFFDND